MSFFVTLHDHKGPVQDGKKELYLNDQETLGQLETTITNRFNIGADYQQLFFATDGTEIFGINSTLKKLGIKEGTDLILKHVFVSKFVNFNKLLGRNAIDLEHKRDIARIARALKETLDSGHFFNVYKNLYLDVDAKFEELMRFLIMYSVNYYLGSRNVKHVLEKKPGGSNVGLIFDYNQNGAMKRFYIKANETNWGANTDARKLIAYLLLQQIGVGPSKCYFIPDAAESKSAVYIATLKVPGFIMAKDLEAPMDERAAVQLQLLAILLNLTDLNTENFGLNSSGSLCIVDFSLTKTYKDSSCSKNFKEHNRRQPALANLSSCSASKRVQIGKESMEDWNFDTAVDQAEKDFIKLKDELKEEVTFLDRATGAIREYLESVRWNVQKLISDWNEENSQ